MLSAITSIIFTYHQIENRSNSMTKHLQILDHDPRYTRCIKVCIQSTGQFNDFNKKKKKEKRRKEKKRERGRNWSRRVPTSLLAAAIRIRLVYL